MIDNITIQFVTDEAGNKQAVLIPFQDWEAIKEEFEDFLAYKKMKKSLKLAFKEVEQIRNGELPKKTMQMFLDL